VSLGKPNLQKSLLEFDIAEYQVTVRNATDKSINLLTCLLTYSMVQSHS